MIGGVDTDDQVTEMTDSITNHDIFNALRAEGADPELEKALFRKLFESSPEGIVLLDNRDHVVRVNSRFLEMFGYAKEEVVGRPINNLIVDASLSEEASNLTRAVLDHESIQAETVRFRKDGSMIYVSILGHPVMVGEGQAGVYGIYRDITQQKLQEEMLRQSEDKHRSIIDTIEDGYFEVDLAGNFLFFNEATRRVNSGRSPSGTSHPPRLQNAFTRSSTRSTKAVTQFPGSPGKPRPGTVRISISRLPYPCSVPAMGSRLVSAAWSGT